MLSSTLSLRSIPALNAWSKAFALAIALPNVFSPILFNPPNNGKPLPTSVFNSGVISMECWVVSFYLRFSNYLSLFHSCLLHN
jgi:hypothetical protein